MMKTRMACLFLFLWGLLVPLTAATACPNILFLIADDWGYGDASCLGHPLVKTPAFDRIAREGLRFNHAYTAAPSCSPSRAAILTGRWPWCLEQGAHLHGFIPTKFSTYPELLESAGYFVGLTNKGYGPGSNVGRKHNAAGPNYRNFEAFLSARPAGKPFCYWLGSGQPHRPYAPGSGVRAGKNPASVKVPAFLPDNATTRSDLCDYLHQVEQFDQQCAAIFKLLETSGEWDRTLIVMTSDNGIPFPRAKATCYAAGTHLPLAVCWGGRMKGGRTSDDWVSLSDLAPTFLEAAGVAIPKSMVARSLMPILLSDRSGQIDPSRDAVLTGMERHVREGRSDGDRQGVGYPMRALVTKDFHYIRNFAAHRWPVGDPPATAVKDLHQLATNTRAAYPDCDAGPTKAWLLTNPGASPRDFMFLAFGKRPEQELYDQKNDPFQLHNLATDPAYAERLKSLDQRLMTLLKAHQDPRVTGQSQVLEK